jgi:hypothetical protein
MIFYILIFSIIMVVPIVAILSQTYLKAKSIGAEQEKGKISKKQIESLLEALEDVNEENKLLKKRVENLEIIVAGSDWKEKLQLPENISHKEVEALAKLLKKKN